MLGVLSIASALTNASVPYLSGRLIDAITSPGIVHKIFGIYVSRITLVIGIWLFIKILADIADRTINYRSDRLEAIIESDYMARGTGMLLELPLSFHKGQKVGEVVNRVNRAASLLGQIISRVLIDLAPQFLSIIIALIITFLIQPTLALVLLGAVALYAMAMFRVAPALGPLYRTMHRMYSRAYGDAYGAVANVETVKQAAAEMYEKRKHARSFLHATSWWLRLTSIWQRLNFYQRLLVTLTQFVIFAFSVGAIRAGQMSIGELVAFNGYAAMLFGPFVILGRNWQAVQNGLTAIVEAEKTIRIKPETYTPENAIMLEDIRGEIEFTNVSFRYQRKREPVLKNVNFRVEPGKTLALVGESGVGKTTLVDLISYYFRPASGHIHIDGHEVSILDLRMLRSRIAVVPQEVMLFNDTVKNNIRYGRFGATAEEIKEAARRAHADEFIERFPQKYNQRVGERGVKLSTGQKQRIAIARAILRDPRILILDEPTSALDAKSEKFITESLETLMRDRTTFIIAHRLSTVRKADLILVFDKGRIAERGAHEELMQIPNGIYRRLYELQIGLK